MSVSKNSIPIPSNMAFHDLFTPDKLAPPDARTLLGLGSKICQYPIKDHTGSLQHTFAWFERDFLLCVIFACESDEGWSYWPDFCWLFDACNKSKLYVNSKWKPTLGDVPYWVSQRLSKFQVRVQRLFKERDATSNLLPHQQHLLNTLPSDPVFLFPEADKGLGPCAVTYDQYVTDVFAHLTNEQVYERLSEEEAMTVVKQLQSDLKSWL